jgi:RNA polymerase sigma-70 factor (ECF subfamily)
VALNVARDLLRQRRRRSYPGPWLPAPVALDEPEPPSFDPPGGESQEARYALVESASFAFLLALEALTPAQRAVLLLRDVADYSVKEAAAALRMSEANVKTTHLRARRALAPYDRDRLGASSRRPAEEKALARFALCLATRDAAGLETLLAEGVIGLGDGGGVHAASPRPSVGRAAVMRLYLGTSERLSGRTRRVGFPRLNGRPALLIETDNPPAGWAPRTVVLLHVDAAGRVGRLYSVMAPRKLESVTPLTAGVSARE